MQLFAKPSIDGYELVSSKRVDRTVFEYSYRLRIQGDSLNYPNLKVLIKQPTVVSGTSVLKDQVSIGQLDAGTLVRTTDVMILRHDRNLPLDLSKLVISFEGKPQLNSANGGTVEIGAVTFFETSTNAGHSGEADIPVQNPIARSNIGLRVDALGSASLVTYRMLGLTGAVIAQGNLTVIPSLPSVFVAPVSIPIEPFKIEISAYGQTGPSTKWTSSKLYTPSQVQMSIIPTRGMLTKGETVSVSINLKSFAASGRFTVALVTPPGFTASQNSWTVDLYPGTETTLVLSLTAPLTGTPYQRYTLLGELSSTFMANSQLAVQKVFVK